MGAFRAPTSEPVTLVGCCHCKATKYTVQLPALKSVLRCSCSICSVNGGIWFFPDPKDVTFERTGPLTKYEWNTKQYSYQFCSVCGNLVRATVKANGAVGLNVRLLQDVNLWELEFNPDKDGTADGPPYQPPEFQGMPFCDDELGESQVYQGSCHCGAVTMAVKTKPLEKCMVNECNCSFCWRAARTHFYPEAEDVHLGGAENLTRYKLTPSFGAYFCRFCGSQVHAASDGPVKDTGGKELAEPEQTLGHNLNIGAVNVRCLHGVDLGKMKFNKYDARDKPPVFSVD